MTNPFAAGTYAYGYCDRCSQRYMLSELTFQVVKLKVTGLRVCPQCLDVDHPQLQQGMYPVEDAIALRDPRRDNSYLTSGNSVLGIPELGSRQTDWGWAPVGLNTIGLPETPNALVGVGSVGRVTITVM